MSCSACHRVSVPLWTGRGASLWASPDAAAASRTFPNPPAESSPLFSIALISASTLATGVSAAIAAPKNAQQVIAPARALKPSSRQKGPIDSALISSKLQLLALVTLTSAVCRSPGTAAFPSASQILPASFYQKGRNRPAAYRRSAHKLPETLC